MKLKVESIYGVSRFFPACVEAEALFDLIRPKTHLTSEDLPHIYKLGFEVEFTKHVQPFLMQAKETDFPLDFKIENGKVTNLVYKG